MRFLCIFHVFSNTAKALKLIFYRDSSHLKLWSLLCICILRDSWSVCVRVCPCVGAACGYTSIMSDFLCNAALIENLYVIQGIFQSGRPIQRQSLFCAHLSTPRAQNECSDWSLMFIYLFKVHIWESELKFIVEIFFCRHQQNYNSGLSFGF